MLFGQKELNFHICFKEELISELEFYTTLYLS